MFITIPGGGLSTITSGSTPTDINGYLKGDGTLVSGQSTPLPRADLPSQIAYKDTANGFTQPQSVTGNHDTLGTLLSVESNAESIGNIFTIRGVLGGFSQNFLSVRGDGLVYGNFSGGGAGLANLNASNLASGTVADARLSSNVPLKDAANVFTLTGNVFTGTTIFRQSGGVAGTDEIQLSHLGSLGLVESKDGNLELKSPTGIVFTTSGFTHASFSGSNTTFNQNVSFNTGFYVGTNSQAQIKLGSTIVLGWTSGTINDPYDFAFVRDSAGVIRVSNGSSGAGHLKFLAGGNIILDTTTGTKIGTGTTQLLGFWNATPSTQPAAIADADGTLADLTTKFNTLLARQRTIGLLAV